jgi:hypothetical protein
MSDDGVDLARLGRLVTLIAFVTAVFLLLASTRLSGTVFSIAVVAIGSVAMVTAIAGALIAYASLADTGSRG